MAENRMIETMAVTKQIVAEKTAFQEYQKGAKRRNVFFDLSLSEFIEIISQECFYCGQGSSRLLRDSTGKIVSRNGIDRLDNDQGYVLENCVPCCGRCNRMKADISLEEFFERISRIYHLRIKGDN